MASVVLLLGLKPNWISCTGIFSITLSSTMLLRTVSLYRWATWCHCCPCTQASRTYLRISASTCCDSSFGFLYRLSSCSIKSYCKKILKLLLLHQSVILVGSISRVPVAFLIKAIFKMIFKIVCILVKKSGLFEKFWFRLRVCLVFHENLLILCVWRLPLSSLHVASLGIKTLLWCSIALPLLENFLPNSDKGRIK